MLIEGSSIKLDTVFKIFWGGGYLKINQDGKWQFKYQGSS